MKLYECSQSRERCVCSSRLYVKFEAADQWPPLFVWLLPSWPPLWPDRRKKTTTFLRQQRLGCETGQKAHSAVSGHNQRINNIRIWCDFSIEGLWFLLWLKILLTNVFIALASALTFLAARTMISVFLDSHAYQTISRLILITTDSKEN